MVCEGHSVVRGHGVSRDVISVHQSGGSIIRAADTPPLSATRNFNNNLTIVNLQTLYIYQTAFQTIKS